MNIRITFVFETFHQRRSFVADFGFICALSRSMLCYLDRGLISGFVPALEKEFGMSNAETGSLGRIHDLHAAFPP